MARVEYTTEQILFGLRELLEAHSGEKERFTLDTRIDEHYKQAGLWKDLDFFDIAFAIEKQFGFSATEAEWRAFCGLPMGTEAEWEREVGPRFTFGHLVLFIREHARGIGFAPMTILGQHCESAGAFRTISDVVDSIAPQHVRFGPSTPIENVLTKRQQVLCWDRLRWVTRGAIPELTLPRFQHAFATALAYVFVASCVGAVAFCVVTGFSRTGERGPAVFFALSGLAFATLLSILLLARRHIPRKVRTFRDLAELIAPTLRQSDTSARP